MKYEYKIIPYSGHINQIDKEINKLGSDGWQLTLIHGSWCYLQRSIIENELDKVEMSGDGEPPSMTKAERFEEARRAGIKAGIRDAVVEDTGSLFGGIGLYAALANATLANAKANKELYERHRKEAIEQSRIKAGRASPDIGASPDPTKTDYSLANQLNIARDITKKRIEALEALAMSNRKPDDFETLSDRANAMAKSWADAEAKVDESASVLLNHGDSEEQYAKQAEELTEETDAEFYDRVTKENKTKEFNAQAEIEAVDDRLQSFLKYVRSAANALIKK